ncbi:MAG: hypothetical protein HC846_11800 [Blastocatellia bacterium]|nr:hypothetical protein [Blastocatellia bacterium]
MEISFLNVDLVIDSTEILQPLVDELAENVLVMFNDEWGKGLNRLSLCLKDSHKKTADEIVSELCFLIENLSSESKSIWDKCHSKKFDIGFESGNIGTLETEISAKTVRRIAKLEASVLITIYPIND